MSRTNQLVPLQSLILFVHRMREDLELTVRIICILYSLGVISSKIVIDKLTNFQDTEATAYQEKLKLIHSDVVFDR